MADKLKKSDTMDIDSLLKESHARHAAPDEPKKGAFGDGYESPAAPGGERFAHESAPSGGSRPSRSGKKSKKALIIALVAAVVVAAGVLGLVLTRQSSASPEPAGAVEENVTVSGVSVGGMSYDDALKALAPAEMKIADQLKIQVKCGDKTVTLTKDDVPCSFNTAEVLRKAQQDGAGSYEIRLALDDSAYAAAAEKAASVLNRRAEDAKVSAFNADKKDMFTYQEAVTGLSVRQDELITRLKALIGSGALTGTVEATCDEVKPAVYLAELRENIRLLSSFTTVSTNTANGMSNQALSLAACNSSIIEPGATWSFNQCTGDTNLESRGYMPAGVIVQGRHEIGIGGGICQSSTTIYNAALLCGMQVVERECHYYPSSYVDYGLDATIDYGNIDLKLKNPFTHQLFLKCWMDGVILHAEIYGLPEKDFDTIKIATTEPTYTKTSYTVRASRTYYLDGKAVRTEQLPSSTYYFSAPDTPTEKPTTAPTAPGTQPATDNPSGPTESPSGDTPTENPGADPGTVPPETPGGDPGTEPGGGSQENPPVSEETTP